MTTSLVGMLAEAKGGPIDYHGKRVMMSYKIPVTTGQDVLVEILRYDNIFEQGIAISIDKRKGIVEVNSQKTNAPIFWTRTAPRTFSFKCFPSKTTGVLNIWNVWENTEYKDNIDAWIGNAGLYVDQEEDGAIVFHCSNGMQQVDFENLVFRIKLNQYSGKD
ncbi:hypothetical protein [Clostridium omnivorum]|uniref:Uncharacterized protein n=1 Tax=Clostridium omnivorum TaxID=1604902 RepID=A0ABQ5N8K1_9CLOT|nr:hypothetical protein [Clostridium sp. E14]GLC31553.1 hypothetical protein bsdE14_29630 [Clostridium sp. E14]